MTTKLKTYPHYKSSGIDWLGELPSHWDSSKLKFVGDARNGLTYAPDDICDEDNGILVLRSSNIQNDALIFKDNIYVNKDINDLLMNEGDILICSRNGSASLIGKCAIIPKGVNATFGAFMMRYRSKLNTRFTLYLIRTTLNNYKHLYSTSTINQLTNATLGNMQVPLPPKEEQEAIAGYLDEVTAKIDSLITEKRAQVEDLRKYRTSLITETVTRGLNPDVSLRPSGIDWLGDVPEHWEIIKMKHCIDISNGSDPKTEGNIPVYGSGAASFKTCGEYKLGPTVLIGRKGATLHIPHWIEGKYWNVDTAFDTKVKSNYNLRFFYYIACSFDYDQYKSQTTLPSMTQSAYENAFIPVPPIAEQQDIADYLDEKTAKIDALIEELEAQLSNLATYKQAVITEAVTGKVDVRDWTPKS